MNLSNNIPDDLVTIQKASEITGFSVAYLRKIIRQNKVATFRHGEKRLLVSPQQIRSLAVPQTKETNKPLNAY